MSYILDALKKSEKERALGSIPTLSTSGQDEKKRVPLSWFVAALVVFIVVAAALGLRTVWQTMEPASVKPDPTKVAPGEASPSTLAATVQPQGPVVETMPANQPAAVQRSPAPEVVERIPDPVPFADLDPSLRNRLPGLAVNVLSYSKNHAKRFVMINQNIYKQGENIGSGIVIEDIREADVVLSFEGVKFLLFP